MNKFKDGTVEYYEKIRSYIKPNSLILDYGSGRGSWFYNDNDKKRRNLRDLRHNESRVIGVDVDDAVLTNPINHENYILTDEWVRENASMFDLISADFVLEHLDDKKKFYNNINTLLKDDGVFCARTPHKYSYVALMNTLIPSLFHHHILKKAQPKRESIDVFKAYYRLNTLQDVDEIFNSYIDESYLFIPEPAYFVESRLLRYLLCCIHKFLPRFFSGQLFIFKKKVNGI